MYTWSKTSKVKGLGWFACHLRYLLIPEHLILPQYALFGQISQRHQAAMVHDLFHDKLDVFTNA